MSKEKNVLNEEVTAFLDGLNHPFRNEIEQLRLTILDAGSGLSEDIKWNGPNYSVNGEDRITMKIQPPKLIQIIFHRGAKVKEEPAEKLIADESKLLAWRENDRAIATFKNKADVESRKPDLVKAIKDWIAATC
jgi:hypothetical protein